jgi:hypothetical protein
VNAQQETVLDASLYGEVRINFASETLPLERFADSARMTLLQRNARAVAAQPVASGSPGGGVPVAPLPPATTAPAPGAPPAGTPPPSAGGQR